METVLNWAFESGQGIFAILFIALLMVTIGLVRWVFNKNDEREKRYINVIDTQATALKDNENIKRDVSEIKSYLFQRGTS